MKRVEIILVLWLSVVGSVDPLHTQSFWQETKGPWGGDIRMIAVTESGSVLAGTPWVLFSSRNQGTRWTTVSTTITYVSAFDVMKNGTVISAGQSFVSDLGCHNPPYDGIRKSTDEGRTWKAVAPCGATYFCLTHDDNGNIYAGGVGSINFGIMVKSTDDGESWQSLWSYDVAGEIVQMEIPRAGYIYGLSEEDYGDGYYVGYLVRSTDYGLTWSYYGNLGGLVLDYLTKDSKGRLLLGTDSTGIYRSDGEKDSTWMRITAANGFPEESNIYTIFAKDSTTIFAGTSRGVYRSVDDGSTWQQSDSGLTYSIVKTFAIDHQGTLYAGTCGGGVFASRDGGVSWQGQVTGMAGLGAGAIAVDSDGIVYAGTANNGGIFKSTDRGGSWQTINFGIPIQNYGAAVLAGARASGFSTQFIQVYKGDTVLAGGRDVGIYRSVDGGKQWEICGGDSGIAEPEFLVMSPCGELLTRSYSKGFLHSTDAGNSWDTLGGQWNSLEYRWGAPSILIVSPNTFIVPSQDTLSRTTDHGRTWQRAAQGLHEGVSAFAIRRTTGTIFATTSQGLSASTNEGESWTDVCKGFPGTVRALAVGEGGGLYASFWSGAGVYRSSNDGRTWVEADSTPLATLVMDKDGYLYGGRNDGVVRSVHSTTGIAGGHVDYIPPRYSLLQNYPNPFNPSTIISYQIPRAGFVSLKIYNLLGQEVAILVNEEKQPGEYKVGWDAGGVPSGVYFYRMESGSYWETKKLLLVK